MICGKCKAEFGDGNFCITCGASLLQATEEAQLAGRNKTLTDGLLNAAAKSKGLSKGIWASVKTLGDKFIVKPAVAFFDLAMRHRRRSALAAGFVLLVAGWGITQGVLSGIGPDQTIQRYVTAIKTADFDALSDASLFPDSTVTPESIQAGYLGEKVKDASAVIVRNKNGHAEVKISTGTGIDSYSIHLNSESKQYFIFFIPEWSVEEPAPAGSIRVANDIAPAQEITFTNDPTKTYSPSEFESLAEDFQLLPGYYSTSVSALGFNQQTDTITSALGTANTQILVDADTTSLSAAATRSAFAKARASAISCAKSKCSSVPKYSATDFYLWGQFAATGYNYTSSRFDYKLLQPTCSSTGFTATSAFRGKATFYCEGTAKGHLYVRYTYYSGWYSDYWYYWDFYDTDTYSFNLSVSVSIDNAGKISVGGVSRG